MYRFPLQVRDRTTQPSTTRSTGNVENVTPTDVSLFQGL